jgi:chemotaxis protein methyltransferase CheR
MEEGRPPARAGDRRDPAGDLAPEDRAVNLDLRRGSADAFELTDDVFRLLRDLIYDRSGIHFTDTNKYLLQKRLAVRARELNLDSFRRYYHFLMYDPGAEVEFERIWDAITTNETYFFREEAQLRALVDEILPELLAAKTEANRGRKPKIRLWSAGCSTGEEPYTIAMMCLERGYADQMELDVFASDIAGTVVSKARSGIYRESSFRSTTPAMREKYFTKNDETTWKIRDSVKSIVTFGRVNLYDTARVDLLGMLDVILCRNVIIYFDEPSKKKVISSFHRRLVPGGYLLLGHSESLISLSTDFRLKHLRNDMVYQR